MHVNYTYTFAIYAGLHFCLIPFDSGQCLRTKITREHTISIVLLHIFGAKSSVIYDSEKFQLSRDSIPIEQYSLHICVHMCTYMKLYINICMYKQTCTDV